MQHGGPPSALLVRQAELQARATRDDLAAYRVAVDFLGPVPVGPVEVRARVVRSGRSVVLVDSELAVAGRTCLHSRTWLIRREAPEPTPVVTGDDPAVPGPDEAARGDDLGLPVRRAHGVAAPSSAVATTPARPRSGAARGSPWCRPTSTRRRCPGCSTPCSCGDSGSGVSSELAWDAWAFLNIDLDVHLLRQPASEWLLLDSRTRLGPDGTGLASTTFRDIEGVVGTGAQTLVVSRR